MGIITPRTDPATLDDCGRQVLSIVTPNTDDLDAWVELIDSSDGDVSELSERARTFANDYGIECPADFSVGDYLEGQILDYRTLRDSDGEVIEIHLLTGFGGPNVWEHINADGDCTTYVYWWGTNGRGSTRHELYEYVFEYMREVVACS